MYGLSPPWRLCTYVYRNYSYTVAAEATWAPSTGVIPISGSAPTPPPLPADHSERIPGSVGTSGGPTLDINSAAPVGSGVSAARFESVVRRSAQRWGLGIGNQVYRATQPNNSPDGYNTVGFSYDLDDGTLGQTTVWTNSWYSTSKRKVCGKWHRSRSGRKYRNCRWVTSRYRHTRVVDTDLSLDAAQEWQGGPAYPSASQFDLESVIIHEFGHVAGNEHVFGCENTPMIVSSGTGERWRAPDDWLRFGCNGVTAGIRARKSSTMRLRHVVREVPASWKPSVR
jgi:hypothetical protein